MDSSIAWIIGALVLIHIIVIVILVVFFVKKYTREKKA